jgi:hypothetical protein
MDMNIKTAINKPVIIYRKEDDNPFHRNQVGDFVHPTTEEAAADLGHAVTPEEYFKWQERFAVGRVIDVERGDKGYAWTLEITNPIYKNTLRSDRPLGMPQWTSPQILTYPNIYPEEERTGIFDHWIVSHVILTDAPAYGFQKSATTAKCVGKKQECLIKTRNASMSDEEFTKISKSMKREIKRASTHLNKAIEPIN